MGCRFSIDMNVLRTIYNYEPSRCGEVEPRRNGDASGKRVAILRQAQDDSGRRVAILRQAQDDSSTCVVTLSLSKGAAGACK